MPETSTVALAALTWLGLLFAVAVYAERRPGVLSRHWHHVYALSLAVHCTSWTFYGTVTQAARYGWPLPPTFIGAIAFYAFAVQFMLRLVRLARESNATSLADLIATRLGKDAWLAATITLVAVLGLIPYIALQLQAVTQSFATLVGGAQSGLPWWRDGALLVALAMAAFTMAFGTRRASAAEHNRGLVLAMAFESLFKLVAMLLLGGFVWWGLRGVQVDATALAQVPAAGGGFLPLVVLGALAMFILPHQFHVGVVECRDERHLKTARWQFPLYLLLIALPTLPLAHAGATMLGTRVSTDMYALALPLSQGQASLALLVFLGGLSAATGMVIVSTLSLSLMIGNHWFAPGLLRGGLWSRGSGDDHRGGLLRLRRLCIVAIMLAGWGYARELSGNEALADVGAVSFSALATLLPALVFAVWWPQTPARAVSFGVVAGFGVWAWVMLPPMLVGGSDWLQLGPFGLHWLSPDDFLGLGQWSRLMRAVALSLGAGTLVTVLLAARMRAPARVATGLVDAATLRNAGRRFLPPEKVEALLHDAPRQGPVPAITATRMERELAAVLGSASTRLLLDAARREAGADLDTVAAIVGEAAQDLRFNQQVLEAALQNMSQGISVVDAKLRLVAWNQRYARLFDYPGSLLRVGTPVADLIAHNIHVGLIGAVPGQQELDKRLRHMRAGTPYVSERCFPDGAVVEIRGNPVPGGGFVATFTDVTAFRHTETALKRSMETLEQRVMERTASLDAARAEAERANQAKTRFLAAIGHDLLQPLHAAQLFTDALAQTLTAPEHRTGAQQIRGALDSTGELLTGLLDMSQLEAGGMVPQPRDVALAEVLEPLASEFGAIAAARGLQLHVLPTRVRVHVDAQLLRRVLQNFLANAVRYTHSGRVLLGVRRRGGRVRIEVHDTGPGIAAEAQGRIFEEFRRGADARGQGLGLGLSIAERVAALLEAPIDLQSRVGFGTVFSISVPMAHAPATSAPTSAAGPSPLAPGQRRILVVDNDVQALDALATLLRGWGWDVLTATGRDGAAAALRTAAADLWLLDYHLDDGDTGLAVRDRLLAEHAPQPTLIVSADAGTEVRNAVLDAGLQWLSKPIKPLALKSVLDRLLAARQARPPSA
ncbi:MAG: PAS-domain containing protein [Pseudoxanthomonas suwonensis]|nr:PAS-domain containing protein [Pseudoxanthomonas suwonensis]